mmetsp:Transcript_59351/g.130337  ORF Transcript_59351/g.130337 Transcript_59351/m.130337 type:complete len:1009 (-) Transcript_59351:23-3049(-)
MTSGDGASALGPSNPKEKALWDAFQRFDVNSDGKIQAEEFQRLMKSLGSFSNKEINRLFKEADSDGSGTLDWREFIKWICTGTATKTMSPDSAASFARLLTRETRDEASFAEQAAASRQLTAYLKEAHQEKSDADKAREQKRKQAQAKKKASNKEKQEAAVPTSGSGVTDASLGISEGYTGFRLPLPVTQEGAQALLEHYLMNGDTDPLHPKYVNYLTTQFTQIYREKHPKSVVYTETPKPGRLVVVGDTHGQLADVCHILYHLGAPSATNRFLFNGDMVDRGPYGVEILLIIFAFFLADPDCLIVHRGNHENEDMNALDADAGGGFIDEVMRKYGLMAYRRFVSAFKAFSLCSVVEKEIFVVHGGLSRVASMSIDYLNSIDHTEVTAPHPMATNIKDQVFSDLVWSDPTDQPGKYKSERGIGIKFGQDITTKFCMQNRLRFVIRSHQVPDDGRGYMKQHDGRCVTIFSASNYCGDGGNYGAVLVLDSQHFPRYEIIEHYAVALEDMPRLLKLGEAGAKEKQKAESEEATTAKRWERELEKMIIGIIEKKPALWAHLVDLSLGTSLDAETWKEMMQEFIEGDHPWLEGARQWGSIDKFGRVHMDKFLNRWIVNMESEKYSSFLNQAVKHVYEAVVGLDMDLNKTLKLFDVDGDGSVDLKEVRQVLGMFNLGLTGSQLDRLTGQIFSQASRVARDHNDGKSEASSIKLNVQEFLGHFTVVYKQTGGGSTAELSDFATEALNAIGGLMMRTPADQMVSDLEKAAVKIQKCFRGVAARKEVKDLKNSSEEARAKSAASLPSPSSAQPAAPSPPAPGTEGMSQQASKMVALFRAMDASGDGILQTDEFVQGLLTLPGIQKLEVQGLALTEDRLRQVAQAVDSFGNGNGTINYLEFLQAFESMEEGNMDIANTLGEDITTVLFRHRLAIRMGCQYLDEEGSGKVKADDFNTVLNGVNSVLARPERALTTTQISLLVEALKETLDGEDTVDYDAFLRAFVILDTERDRAVVKRF